ncbi:MAG: hypothetical protein N838_04575 [Thiohalocapsa sp. PB-PSB1]|nr:MAG: hypothetical protein N838_04575 [Thiohalocapsa sp. PB-PSB1]
MIVAPAGSLRCFDRLRIGVVGLAANQGMMEMQDEKETKA